jgi:hypothetical protein
MALGDRPRGRELKADEGSQQRALRRKGSSLPVAVAVDSQSVRQPPALPVGLSNRGQDQCGQATKGVWGMPWRQ